MNKKRVTKKRVVPPKSPTEKSLMYRWFTEQQAKVIDNIRNQRKLHDN